MLKRGADFCLAVLGVELETAIQRAISIIHDAARFTLAILERMIRAEVVPELVREGRPASVNVVHTSGIATSCAQRSDPSKADGAIASGVAAREEVRGRHIGWIFPRSGHATRNKVLQLVQLRTHA